MSRSHPGGLELGAIVISFVSLRRCWFEVLSTVVYVSVFLWVGVHQNLGSGLGIGGFVSTWGLVEHC